MKDSIHNLRPAAADEFPGLRPISLLKPIFNNGEEIPKPLASNGNTLIYASGTILFSFRYSYDKEPMQIADLGEEILCATFLSEQQILVSTVSGMRRVGLADKTVSSRRSSLPPAVITCSGTVPLSADIGSFGLSGTYSQAGGTLDLADVLALTRNMKSAYGAIAASASASGLRISPVLARYRLLDANGVTLVVSPPLLVGTTGTEIFPLCKAVDIPVIGDRTSPLSVSCNAYTLQLVLPAVNCPEVESLVVEVTDEISPLDFSLYATGGIVRSSSDGTFHIHARFPGALNSNALGRNTVIAALEKEKYRVAGRVRAPFDGTARKVVIGLPADKKYVSSDKLPKGIANADFSATSLTRCGSTVVAANPVFYRYAGHNPLCFARTTGDLGFRCSSEVEFADGSVCRTYGSFGAMNPITLNPIISYPGTDAVRISLNYYYGNGSSFTMHFPLTPSANGNMAYYLAEDLAPIPLAGNDAPPKQPDPVSAPEAFSAPGAILSFRTDSPMTPVSLEYVSDFPLHTVVAATGSSAAWDHVRARFYLFAKNGIFSAVCNGTATVASVAKISEHPVPGKASVAVTPETLFVLTANGALVELSGVRTKVVGRFPEGSISYDNTYREIVIHPLHSHTRGCVYGIDTGETYTRTLPGLPFARLNATEGTWFSLISGEIYRFGVEDESVPSEIGWKRIVIPAVVSRVRVSGALSFRRYHRLSLAVSSAEPVSLSLKVTADHGAGADNSRTLMARDISGQVNSPFYFAVPAPHFPALHLELSGKLPACARIYDFNIVR